jgi:hypothetical protein
MSRMCRINAGRLEKKGKRCGVIPCKGEKEVAANAARHRHQHPGDVAPRLVHHQAQQRGGRGRHQVH